MNSYIKIYGPPLLKAIKALEKIAIDLPKVCIMNTQIKIEFASEYQEVEDIQTFFRPIEVPKERCESIISKSGQKLGDYDFFYEWSQKPTTEELNELMAKIDAALAPLGCKYTMTTK